MIYYPFIEKHGASYRESRGCKCSEMTAALWSAGQEGLRPGGDLEMNPGRTWPHQDVGPSGRGVAAVAAVSLAGPGPADAGAVGSAAACY